MATNENLIPVPGRLHSVASEGHVAGANEIIDDDFTIDGTTGQSQADINSYLDGNVSAKADKLPMTGAGAATENNFMAIDANGNIKDSRKKASDFLTQHQSIKTINSASIVGSGNVDLQVPITDLKSIGCAYVICGTASATAAKTATLTGFELRTNCIVSVLFTEGFTTSNSTLDINDTGAKPIFYHGAAVEPFVVRNNTVAILQYDGTNWNIVSVEVIVKNTNEEAVDLGLPSGTLWCTHNLGATKPEEYGLYFSWGNVEGHQSGSGYVFNETNYNASTGSQYQGTILSSSYDAAHAIKGGEWRMPTIDECLELCTMCTTTATTLNGIAGLLYTSKQNGKTLFIPHAGYMNNSDTASSMGSYHFVLSSQTYSNSMAIIRNGSVVSGVKYQGCSIRPVI